MRNVDIVGYAAALAVLATFCMSTIVPLRIVAIVSNVLFALYGVLADLYPVFVLHSILLPINLFKLAMILLPINLSKLAMILPSHQPLFAEGQVRGNATTEKVS